MITLAHNKSIIYHMTKQKKNYESDDSPQNENLNFKLFDFLLLLSTILGIK
jgi:hypothetical protein